MPVTVNDIRHFVEKPKTLKPHFAWESLEGNLIIPGDLPVIQTSKGEDSCQPKKLLSAVGAAITDERLAQGLNGEEQIFSAETKFRVVSTVNRALLQLLQMKAERKSISSEEVHEVVEDALFQEGEVLAAKGYLLYRTRKQRRAVVSQDLAVLRRSGKTATWDPERIFLAIQLAFFAPWLEKDTEPNEDEKKLLNAQASKVSAQVVHEITGLSREAIHVEEIQDVVERTLFNMGYEEVATRFGLYRQERARVRQLKIEEESQPILTEFITAELLARIDFASSDLELPLSREELAGKLVHSMGLGLSEKEVMQTVLLNTRNLIEKDPVFRFFAARILLSYIYEETLEWTVTEGVGALRVAHEEGFKHYIDRGIELGLLSEELKNFDLEVLGQGLNPMADLKFDYLGIHTLYDRYLLHDRESSRASAHKIINKEGKRRFEVPQFMWMRVAMGLSYNEKDKEEAALNFYHLYTSKKFCSSTPTLFNSGTKRPQLSSCYGLSASDEIGSIKTVGDSTYPVGIFGTFSNCAQLSKYAGGLGVDFTYVRGTGSHIHGTNGESLGIVPFLKIMNDTAVAVNQGGKRRGVCCAYLETWHNDIEEFLELRKNTGDERRRTHDLHSANWIPDLFIVRAIKGENWTLFRSNEVPDLHRLYGAAFKERYEHYEKLAEEGKIYGRKIKASMLWKKMLSSVFETGHPWMTFKDPCNVRSPQDHVGVIHNSNLCTEITLNNCDDEHFVCNLGSINLPSFIKKNKRIDYKDLGRAVQLAVRMLDNVIDINFYPTIPAKNANLKHRPVGLGLMGWQEALHKLGICFDSQEMVALADKVMEFIAWHAYSASSQLAKERGSYESFKGSKWDRGLMPLDTLELLEQERGIKIDVNRDSEMPWDELRKRIKRHGMRNSNVLAIAPTATISNIMGTSACIEPDYRHIYSKSNLSGEFVFITPSLVEALKSQKLWNEETLEELKYYKGELDQIESIPESLRAQFKTAFKIDQRWLIDAAAVRQKWIDQSQSINLFLDRPDEKLMSQLYLYAWKKGLKTTYYLKNKSASDIEDASLDIRRKRKEMSEAQPKACSIDNPDCEACQ